MQDKQKVTLYIPPELHRKLKIRSAIESEPMSVLAERAIIFYLSNPEVVEQAEAAHGHTHRVYSCPACTTPVVLKEGEMVPVGATRAVIEDELPVEKVQKVNSAVADSQGEEELVPC